MSKGSVGWESRGPCPGITIVMAKPERGFLLYPETEQPIESRLLFTPGIVSGARKVGLETPAIYLLIREYQH